MEMSRSSIMKAIAASKPIVGQTFTALATWNICWRERTDSITVEGGVGRSIVPGMRPIWPARKVELSYYVSFEGEGYTEID